MNIIAYKKRIQSFRQHGIDITKPIPPKLAIADIDAPLYAIGLIHTAITPNTRTKPKWRALKSILATCWMAASAARFALYIILHKKNQIQPLFVDIIQYLGGSTLVIYVLSLLLYILCTRICYLFNVHKFSYSGWIRIIAVLKGLEPVGQLAIGDADAHLWFFYRVKKFKTLIRAAIYQNSLSYLAMTAITSLIHLRQNSITLADAIASPALFTATSSYMIAVILTSFLYYYIECLYCRLRFQAINADIGSISRRCLASQLAIRRLLIDHDMACKTVAVFNGFWKNYYFALVYTLIPINLMLLQNVVYEKIHAITLSAMSAFLVSCLSCHLSLNRMTATINKETGVSYKRLYNSTGFVSIRYHLKMLTAMERVSDKNRLIGFSCGNQFVMTPLIAFKMFVLFCRYFLLTVKFANSTK